MENFSSSNENVVIPDGLRTQQFPVKKIVFYFLLILFFLFIFNSLFLSSPVNFPAESIQFIKEGSSLRSVSLHFKNENIIKSRLAFETSVMLYGGERHVIPGDYLFERKLPVFEIARRITEGDKQLAPLKVTIPEGYNVLEVADVFFSKLPHFNKEQFLLLAGDKEGYLFPDTYFFLTESTEVDALEYMSKNFEKKIAPLRDEILKTGKTEKEIIIMASIIEREAKGEEDREIISGILWKRIKIGVALQVDAWSETYKEKGLPDTPISNPGLQAIKASMYPKTSPYLYYLHGKDGETHYAKSFEEHKQNIAKYLR